MKTTPMVNFQRVNANINVSTPSLGISHVLARTTKGPFNEPDTIINSVEQFRSIFGKELVPDNSISNIERALNTGSTLRISRVEGGTGAEKGTAKTYIEGVGGETAIDLVLKLVNPLNASDKIEITLNIETKEAGGSVTGQGLPGGDNEFYFQIAKEEIGPSVQYSLTQYKDITEEILEGGIGQTSNILSRDVILRSSTVDGEIHFIDFETFANFYYNNPNIQFKVKSFIPADKGIYINNIEDVISTLRTYSNWRAEFTLTEDVSYYVINEGSTGGDSTNETWLKAYDAIAGYTDGYQLIASHLHQHITDYEATYKSILTKVKEREEILLFVEIPKTSESEMMNYTETLAKVKTMVAAIGYSPYVAYFGGGIKLYDSNAALKYSDVLGTVLGLSDTSATNAGPWKSFAGMNRGLVIDGHGSTIKGGMALTYPQLDEFAKNSLNLFIVQDTPTAGKRTMLWHNFTGSIMNSSDQFISSMRAFLYLKKNIRPILQKYIEEQNTFATWRNIYEEVRPILDTLVGQVFTEYQWQGDQFTTSYEELQVNNETDVRSGKYKVILSYKDIVSLQEINLQFFIEKSDSSLTINTI